MSYAPLSMPVPSRITLNLARLIETGELSAREADRLRGLAERSQLKKIVVNLLLIFGSLMVVGGILALEPTAEMGLGLAATALLIGSVLFFRGKEEWGLLGQALTFMGVLGLCGWIGMRFSGFAEPFPHLMWPTIAVLLMAGAIVYRNTVLVALSAIAIGYMLGGATAYWHASYALIMEEPVISIVAFAALGAGAFWLRDRLPTSYQQLATVFWRTCFLLANFGFWIGSLWGDYVLDGWLASRMNWETFKTFRDSALFIPDIAFVLTWPAALLATIAVGTRTQQLFLVNTAIVFLGIHFYT
jgi:iron complex transport system permease protein